MDIYKAGDKALRQVVQQERHLDKAHRARCEEASEKVMAAIRKEFDFKFDTEEDFYWILNRHVITFGAGPQTGRPTGESRLPDAELVMYISNEDAFEGLEDLFNQNSELFLSTMVALNNSPNFSHVQYVIDKRTLCHYFKVTVDGATIVMKYSWELMPNPKEDFVANTYFQMKFLLKNCCSRNKPSSLSLDTELIIPVLSKLGTARLAKYLREQPEFIKNVVALAKLWLACNMLGEEAPEDPFLVSLTELVAIRCGQIDAFFDGCALEAFTELLRLMSKDANDVCVFFYDVKFGDSVFTKKFVEMGAKTGVFLDPVNPYMNYFSNPDARNAWKRLRVAAAASLKKFQKYEQNRGKWWRRVEPAEKFWTDLLFNKNAQDKMETKVGFWRQFCKCLVFAIFCVLLTNMCYCKVKFHLEI